VLVWVRAEDLTRVPVEVVAVRHTRERRRPRRTTPQGCVCTRGSACTGAVAARRLHGVRLRGRPVAFRGFVPNASLGPVFVRRRPTRAGNDWSMLQSNVRCYATARTGRVIAQFSPQGEHVSTSSTRCTLLGESAAATGWWSYPRRRGLGRALRGAGLGKHTRPPHRARAGVGRGFGSGSGFGSGRSLRVALTAGTPISDECEAARVIGVAYDDSVVVADQLPEGGFEFDI
jgi:hypothetical protein